MLRVDKLQLDLVINGDETRKQLFKLQGEAAELRKQMKGIKDQELIGKKQQELSKIESEMEDLRHTIGITGMTMKELKERAKQLSIVLQNVAPGTPEFTQYKQELDQVTARQAELKRGAEESRGALMENSKISSSIAKGLAIYSTVVGAIAGVVAGIKASIEAYREQERAIQKVDQAIKQTGGSAGLSLKQLTDEATRMQNSTLFGDEEILNSATAQLLTFTNIAGENFLKAQRAAMDLSTVLDGDLQTASIQLGKALNDPASGIAALTRVGISFTNEQKSMIKELAETNRLEEAQALILDEVNRQYGGQAEAVAKGTGAFKQAANQIGELAESFGGFIGNILAPLMTMFAKFATSINEILQPSKTAVEIFEDHGRSVASLVQDIDPLLTKYDDLKAKTNLSASEQKELQRIIAQITAVMPGAASAFDQYGNAIEISSSRVREHIKNQVLLLRYENQKAIDETISNLADANLAIDQLKPKMNQIAKSGSYTITEQSGQNSTTRKARPDEVAAMQRQYQEMANTQTALNTKLGQLRGDALQQSLDSYTCEKKAASETAGAIIDYKKMEVDELQALESDGNETQKKNAKEELKRREDLKKNAEEYAKYLKKISEDLENARVQAIKDSKEKELKMEELAYQKKLSEIKGNTEKELQLKSAIETQYHEKINAIQQKYQRKETEEAYQTEKIKTEIKLKSLAEGSIQWFDISQQLIDAQRQFELSNTELTESQKLEIEAKYRDMRQKLIQTPDDSKIQSNLDSRMKAESDAELMMLERTGQLTIEKKRELLQQERDMALASHEGNSEQQKLIWEQYYTDIDELNTNTVAAAIAGLNSLIGSLSTLDQAITAYQQAELQKDEEKNNIKKARLKNQLDTGIISQKQYNEETERMDRDLDQKKKKMARDAAIRQKALAIVQAIINTAQAITAALALPIAGIALAVVAGVIGAAQVALIAATPIPEAAKGRYNVLGMEDKKVYQDVPYIERPESGIYSTPTLFAETGREIILNPIHTENLMKFRPDLVQAIMAVPQRSTGFYEKVTGIMDMVPAKPDPKIKELEESINKLSEILQKGIRAHIKYDDMIEAQSTVSMIEKSATR